MNQVKPGEVVGESRIYKCSNCSNPKALIKDDKAPDCEYCGNNGKDFVWKPTRKEILIRTRNIKKEFESQLTVSEKISQLITDFCGSMKFIYIHIVWFAFWLVYNFLSPLPFDPFPFGLLTLIVSLEAIILATFILISQNRQAEVSELRSELDYQVDLSVGRHSDEILSILHEINSKLDKKKKL